jgi:hypothetical protein
MRTADSKIKSAILHPEDEVRITALRYFTGFHSADNGLMPLVTEAVEKYGRGAKAFRILRAADDLVQTEETVRWLTNELSREWDLSDVGNDNYCSAVALILCNTAVELLNEKMADLPCFPIEFKDTFEERIEFASRSWDDMWTEFEDLGADVMGGGHWRMDDIRFASLIVERLAQFPEKADFILPLLQRNYQDADRDLIRRLEPFIVELAGRMRLEQAAPIIAERLHEDNWFLAYSRVEALTWIGGDVALSAIADHWPGGNAHFRRSAADVLEHIHSDLSLQKCAEFFAKEEDADVKECLANALINQFSQEAIEPVRQMVLCDALNPELRELRRRLVATAAIMGASFPEYEQWYDECVANHWGQGEFAPTRIRENFQVDEEEYELEDDDWELEEEEDQWADEDWEAEEDYGDEFEDYEEERLRPIRHDNPRVGRNDPCPCGSGKKYKKCCLGKEHQYESDSRSKYPIGTVALYGPDDKTTTKIAASVIKNEGAEPILKRWVSSNVKDNPKVQREIREFFKKHNVKSVVATDGNMGCPHEEGKDFPVGGDCPFCPYWKGKQGSGAT